MSRADLEGIDELESRRAWLDSTDTQIRARATQVASLDVQSLATFSQVYFGVPSTVNFHKFRSVPAGNFSAYSGTSIIKNSAPARPYSRTMPRALWCS